MNAEQTKAFFAPLSWTLVEHMPDQPRWALVSPSFEGVTSILGFDNLHQLWRYWKLRVNTYALREAILPYVVEEYLSGDEAKRESIMDWVISNERAVANTTTPAGIMWTKVRVMEQEVTPSLKRWRHRLVAYYGENGKAPQRLYLDFLDRVRDAMRHRDLAHRS